MKMMLPKFALTAVFLSVFSGTAFAIEVEKSTVVNAPINQVWEKLGGWCAIKDWHPAIVGCKEDKKGDEMRRTLTLDGGGEIVELLKAKTESSYDYIIESSPLPIENYKSSISVSGEGEGKTKVTWVSNFDAKGTTDDEANNIITGVYEAGMASIAKMFK